MSPLTDKKQLKQLLANQQHMPSRSAGQNFLICQPPVTATVTALPDTAQRVTELGAGAGSLTEALLKNGRQVLAIERDQALVSLLQNELASRFPDRLTVVRADLRQHHWEQERPYALVGNIPYNLSGFILRRLPNLTPQPEQVVLLLQKEVGQRLITSPPNMSLLSVAVQLWGTPNKLLSVPASCFWPQPEVDSMLVSLTPHTKQLSPAAYQSIINLARLAFGTKRKQIGGSLRRGLNFSEEVITERLARVGLKPTQRPEEVYLQQWQELERQLTTNT